MAQQANRVPRLHVSRKLSDIVKLPLLQENGPDAVRHIWLNQAEKPRIVNGVMAGQEYKEFRKNMEACPMFPVPVFPEGTNSRSSYYNLMMQCGSLPAKKPTGSFISGLTDAQGNMLSSVSDGKNLEAMFTFLEDYQKNPTTAFPYIVLLAFEELLNSHNVVLLRADIVTGKLTKKQGEAVVKLTRELYSQPELFRYVDKFNNQPRQFDYNEFVSKSRIFQ